MRELKESTVIIEEVTFESNQFIKEYTHCSHPTLSFENVIDILYAAKKHLIYQLIKECETKILSLDGPTAFYAVITAINKYPTSTFQRLLDDLMRSQCVTLNVINILQWMESNKHLNKLSLKQMIMLIENTTDHQVRYIFCKKYCEFAAGKEWRNMFTAQFKQKIAFRFLSIYFIGQTVAKDHVLSYDEFIALIANKTESEWSLYGIGISPNFCPPSSSSSSSPHHRASPSPSPPPHILSTVCYTASSPICSQSPPTSLRYSPFPSPPEMSPISLSQRK